MNDQRKHRVAISHSSPTVMEIYNNLPEITGCEVVFNKMTMSPSPSKEHQLTFIKLSSLLFQFFEDKQTGILLSAPFDVYFEELRSVVQPDLFIILNEDEGIIKENGVYGAPAIIIEIISTNKAYDTKRKRALYEKAGVKEYFMIDPKNKKTTLLTLNDSGVYEQTYEETGLLRSEILPFNFSF